MSRRAKRARGIEALSKPIRRSGFPGSSRSSNLRPTRRHCPPYRRYRMHSAETSRCRSPFSGDRWCSRCSWPCPSRRSGPTDKSSWCRPSRHTPTRFRWEAGRFVQTFATAMRCSPWRRPNPDPWPDAGRVRGRGHPAFACSRLRRHMRPIPRR